MQSIRILAAVIVIGLAAFTGCRHERPSVTMARSSAAGAETRYKMTTAETYAVTGPVAATFEYHGRSAFTVKSPASAGAPYSATFTMAEANVKRGTAQTLATIFPADGVPLPKDISFTVGATEVIAPDSRLFPTLEAALAPEGHPELGAVLARLSFAANPGTALRLAHPALADRAVKLQDRWPSRVALPEFAPGHRFSFDVASKLAAADDKSFTWNTSSAPKLAAEGAAAFAFDGSSKWTTECVVERASGLLSRREGSFDFTLKSNAKDGAVINGKIWFRLERE